MKTKTTHVPKSIFFLLLHLSYASTSLFASSQRTDQKESTLLADQRLALLFKYRKQSPNKANIDKVTQGLASQILPLLQTKYSPTSLQNALGGAYPTNKDKNIFLSLQWAYQQGTSHETTSVPQDIKVNLCQVFSAWRRSSTTIGMKIVELQNQLPNQLSQLIKSKKNILETDFKEELGYRPNDKDMAFVFVLQWAYQQATQTLPFSSQDQSSKASSDSFSELHKESSNKILPYHSQPSPDHTSLDYQFNRSRQPSKTFHINNLSRQQPTNLQDQTTPHSSPYWIYILIAGCIFALLTKKIHEQITSGKNLPKPSQTSQKPT